MHLLLVASLEDLYILDFYFMIAFLIDENLGQKWSLQGYVFALPLLYFVFSIFGLILRGR